MTQGERILSILSDGERHSHHEFYGFCVLHSRISDLRKQGHDIVCFKTGGVYEYQLTVREAGVAGNGGDPSGTRLHGPSDGPPEPVTSQTPESAEVGGLSPGPSPATLPVPQDWGQLSVFEAA